MKPLKKKKNKALVPAPLPPLDSREKRGKFADKSTVAYRLTLPVLPDSREDVFFSRLGDAFLSFLEKESKKERDEVFFGGITFSAEQDSLLLLFAFCPFSLREFQPFARLTFDDNGQLQDVLPSVRKKRPRGSRPTPASSKDNPPAKGSAR